MKSKKIFILLSALALSLAACGGGKGGDEKKSSGQETPTSQQSSEGGEDEVAVTALALNKETLSLEEGKSENLSVTVTPANASNTKVTWESSNAEVATVSSLGKVSALKVGQADITVKSVSNPEVTAVCHLTVTEEGGHYGSVNKPLTIAKALAVAAEECKNDGDVSKDQVYVKGFVSKPVTQNEDKGYSGNVYLKDSLTDAQAKELLVYSVNRDALTTPYQGDEVILHGYIKLYGTTIEIASAKPEGASATVYPQVDSIVSRGTSEISYSVSHGQVNAEAPTSGKNMSKFSFSVTPEAGYQVNSVTINGEAVTAKQDGSYEGIVKGNTAVVIDIGEEGVTVLTAEMKSIENQAGNMVGGQNNAAIVNLDPTLFNVDSTNPTGPYAGVYSDDGIRLYNNHSSETDKTDGTEVIVSSNRVTVSKIAITLARGTFDILRVKAGDEVVTGENGVYEFSASSFSLKNVSNAAESDQVRISKVIISYSMKETVHATAVAVSESTAEIEADKTVQLNATLTPANATDAVVWKSSNEAVAKVSASGLVVGVAEGTATITAFADANENGQLDDGEFSDTCALTVKPAKVINYGTAEAPLNIAEAKAVLDETGTSASKQPLFVKGVVFSSTYSTRYSNYDIWLQSDDGSVEQAFECYSTSLDASITGDYTAENALKGFEIVATGYGMIYGTKYELTNVTIEGEKVYPTVLSVQAPSATGVELDKDSLTLTPDGTATLVASVVPAGAAGDISWATSDASIATVADGVVTAHGVGTATITAFIDADGDGVVDEGELKAECEVEVSAADIHATSITLDKESGELVAGQKVALTAVVEPSNTTDTVSWSTSDPAVATVADGVVTAVGAGTATITVAAGDQSDTYELTVVALTAATNYVGAAFSATGKLIYKNGKNAIIDDGTGGIWAYASANVSQNVGDVVSVSGTSKIYSGGLEVDGAAVAAATGSVTESVATPLTEAEAKAYIDDYSNNVAGAFVPTKKVSLRTGTIAGSGQYLTFPYGDANMETKWQNGNMEAGKQYDIEGYIFQFYKDNNANKTYLVICVTKAEVVPVPAEGLALNKDTLELEEGKNETLTATLTPAGATDTVKWLSSDTAVATVDANGKVTAVAQGTATITAFIDADNDGAVGATELNDTCAVTVTEASGGGGAQTETTVTLTPANLATGGMNSTAGAQSYSGNGLTIAVSNGVCGDQCRVYKSATITFTAANIKSIVLTCTANGTAQYGPGCFADLAGYTFEASGKTGTWTGDAASVTLTASTNQVRITQIVITYTPAA